MRQEHLTNREYLKYTTNPKYRRVLCDSTIDTQGKQCNVTKPLTTQKCVSSCTKMPNYSISGPFQQHPLRSAHATKEYYHLRRKIPTYLDASLNSTQRLEIARKRIGSDARDKTRRKAFCNLLQEAKWKHNLGSNECNTCETYCDVNEFVDSLNTSSSS